MYYLRKYDHKRVKSEVYFFKVKQEIKLKYYDRVSKMDFPHSPLSVFWKLLSFAR